MVDRRVSTPADFAAHVRRQVSGELCHRMRRTEHIARNAGVLWVLTTHFLLQASGKPTFCILEEETDEPFLVQTAPNYERP